MGQKGNFKRVKNILKNENGNATYPNLWDEEKAVLRREVYSTECIH